MLVWFDFYNFIIHLVEYLNFFFSNYIIALFEINSNNSSKLLIAFDIDIFVLHIYTVIADFDLIMIFEN